MSWDNTAGKKPPSQPEDGPLVTGLDTMPEDDYPIQNRDERLLRLAQQQREEALKALKKSRRAGIYPPSTAGTVTAGLSSNTQLPTAPAATPQDDGGPGPSCLQYPMRGAGVDQFQRWKERMNTPPIDAPPIPRSSRNGPRPPRRQPPYFHTDTPHPYTRRRGMPVYMPPPPMPVMGHVEHDYAFGEPRRALFREPYMYRPETPRFHTRLRHSDAEAIGFMTGLVASTPPILAAPGESGLARTDAIGVAGPSEVVMTGTRGARCTISAEEIFREVRECVIEYLGSDVEG